MVLSRTGYTISLILILIIIGVACAAFYFKYDSSSATVNLSPEETDGVHLECVDICKGTIYTCSPRCQYVAGEGPDLCGPIGSICSLN
ncbi:MAG: hypothetical protein AABX10_03995 [Nanoarchaeota archaeon]